jgi:hypothetical protein
MAAPSKSSGPRVLPACLAVLGGCLVLPLDMGPLTAGRVTAAVPAGVGSPAAAVPAGVGSPAAAVPPVIVRGRRIPVLPRRVARMEARGEILELRPQPPAPPVVIVERQPPVVIRERITEGLAGRLPARLAPPADAQAARPFRPRGIEPATAISPEPGTGRAVPAAPEPALPLDPATAPAATRVAEPLPPIELLPSP